MVFFPENDGTIGNFKAKMPLTQGKIAKHLINQLIQFSVIQYNRILSRM